MVKVNTDILDFIIYGDVQRNKSLELLHCEPLVERSRKHNWKIKAHRHSGVIQLFYVQQGEARAQLDGKLVQLTPPCLLVVPDSCVHDFIWSEDVEGHVLSIATPLFNRITHSFGNADDIANTPTVHDTSDNQYLLNTLFKTLENDYTKKLQARELMIEALLTVLSVYLLRNCSDSTAVAHRQDRGKKHFSAFTELIELHYRDHWRVADYAEQLGVTAPHLNSICRKIVQQTALEVIHARLLLEAKRSLIYTGRTISEIAFQLGFSDPSHFTRFFKNKGGISPKGFRDRQFN